MARSHLLTPGTEGYAKGVGTCPREHPNDMPSDCAVVDPTTCLYQTDLAVKKMTSFTGAGYVHHASAYSPNGLRGPELPGHLPNFRTPG